MALRRNEMLETPPPHPPVVALNWPLWWGHNHSAYVRLLTVVPPLFPPLSTSIKLRLWNFPVLVGSVQTPPISTCTASGSASSPTGVSVSNIPNSPSGSGNGGGSARGISSSTILPSSLLVLFLFGTTLTFTFTTTI